MDVWDQVALLACVFILVALAITVLISWVDSRRPKQQDWVAQRHREIRKAGEKTRQGAR
jgi:hypothetical protein